MRHSSQYILASVCCLGTLDVLGMFGLIVAQQSVTPDVFNSAMIGFVCIGGGVTLSGLGICVREYCCPIQATANKTSDKPNPPPPKIVSTPATAPSSVALIIKPVSQKYKYEPISTNFQDSPTSKAKASQSS